MFMPFFNDRRGPAFNNNVSSSAADFVGGNDSNLTSKIYEALESADGLREKYESISRRVLGKVVRTISVANGVLPGYTLGSGQKVPITRMGDGMRSAADVLAEIARGGEYIFLMEEPESDLHPAALRALLTVIAEHAENSQFLISTHSDLVVRFFGGDPKAAVYEVFQDTSPDVPITHILGPLDTLGRRDALERMGFQWELPPGWIILEESSAERVIRDIIIPNFVPQLAQFTTLASGGFTKTESLVDELSRTILSLHKTEKQDRVWVLIDGGKDERTVIEKLQAKYKTWNPQHFSQFSAHNFEEFYPPRFSSEVDDVLAVDNSLDRSRRKGKLAETVVEWALANPSVASKELADSAGNVIEALEAIARQANEADSLDTPS